MNRKVLGILIGLLAMGVAASAAVTTCTAGSGSFTLVSANVSNTNLFSDVSVFGGDTPDACNAYGLTFSNFSVYINSGFAPSTPFSMNVTFQTDGTLLFGSNLVPPEDINLQYKVASGTTSEILSSGGSAGTGVNVNICKVQQPMPGGGCSDANLLGSGNVSGSNTVTIAIAPNSVDWIFKDISGTSTFSERVVPEPMTLSMMGIGLLGLGLMRRRQAGKK